MGVSLGRMTAEEVRSFARRICNLDEGRKSGTQNISSINESEDGTTPAGQYPDHWVDTWHELEGGDDRFGQRPRYGDARLIAEMNGLPYDNGCETAWDHASNENLIPELVHAARAVEMEYFEKLGVYEKCPRSHQIATG